MHTVERYLCQDSSSWWKRGAVSTRSSCISVNGKISWNLRCPSRSFQESAGVSLVWPDEKLLPGHKYLIIPSTTAQKFTHKHTGSVKVKGFAQGKDEIIDVNITWDPRLDISEESVGSAREFYTSKDRWPRYKVKRTVKAKKPFVPLLPKARSFRGSGWEPSLNSVQEVSP